MWNYLGGAVPDTRVIEVRRATLHDQSDELYAVLNPEAALAFRAAAEKELELLCAHPFIGRRRHFRTPGLRSWRISGFENYLIFYRSTDLSLEVVRVLHGAQDLQRILGLPKQPQDQASYG